MKTLNWNTLMNHKIGTATIARNVPALLILLQDDSIVIYHDPEENHELLEKYPAIGKFQESYGFNLEDFTKPTEILLKEIVKVFKKAKNPNFKDAYIIEY
jgi:hypothetical protein